MSTAGLLLAAGAGRRSGGPKALRRNDVGQTWVEQGILRLAEAGCAPLVVVAGAASEQVVEVLNVARAAGSLPRVAVVTAHDWGEGMGASLRAGLAELSRLAELDEHGQTDCLAVDSVIVMLVDLPDVDAEVIRRVRIRVEGSGDGPSTLARAAYQGLPGHPVVLGRDHWGGVIAQAVGDQGAREYLVGRAVQLIEAGDLASGVDRDGPL